MPNYLDSFLSVDPFSNSRNKSLSVMAYDPFNVPLWFAGVLFRIFVSVFTKDICNKTHTQVPSQITWELVKSTVWGWGLHPRPMDSETPEWVPVTVF